MAAVTYRRWSFTSGSWMGKLWCFGRLRWSLTRGGCKWRFDCIFSSLRSKRFRLVSEQRKTEEQDFRFRPREMEREPKKMKEGGGGGEGSFPPHLLPALLLAPFFAWSSTLVPRSLLRNRTEKLATQVIFFPMSLLLPYLSLFTTTVHISFQVPGWIGDARFGFKKERWTDFTIIKMCRWTKICKIAHGNYDFCPIVGIPSKITHLFHVSSMYS